MRKKIKNLSDNDCKRICESRPNCDTCPLNIENSNFCMADLRKINVKELKAQQEVSVNVFLPKRI